MNKPWPSSFSHGNISFHSSLMGIEWRIRSPEYQVKPALMNRIRGKKISISDGLVGMAVWEKIGVVELFSCQGAKLALESKDLILIKNCCNTYAVVSSGDSLGGILILMSTRVSCSCSSVLSMGSVVSDPWSSSEKSILRGGESEYCNSTGESSDESSEDMFSMVVLRLLFF